MLGGLIGSIVLLQAPFAFAAGDRPVRSLLETRHDRVVVQEWDLSCGAAALATLLNHQLGDGVSEREIARGLIQREEYIKDPNFLRFRQGFSLLDLKRYVDQRGYQGIGLGKLTLSDLQEHAPIMVPVDFKGYKHFVIFRGIGGNRVLVADPAFGNRTMSISAFEDAWLDHPKLGRVGFSVARADGIRLPNRLAPKDSDFVTLR
ncbi:MAG: C39 family peptidase [Geminicoccaceae bacterium]